MGNNIEIKKETEFIDFILTIKLNFEKQKYIKNEPKNNNKEINIENKKKI